MDSKQNLDERTCVGCVNREFRFVSVCPTRERTELFVDSQWSWGRISTSYVAYRVAVAVLMVAWVVADFCVEAGRWYSFNRGIWLVFATNWSFLLLVASCVVQAVTAANHARLVRCSRRDEKDLRLETIGGGLAAQWILYNVATNASIVVSISYWAFVAIIDGSGFLTTSMSQLKHTLNSVYVLVDLFVSAVPLRVLHVVYPLAFGVSYALFNAVYFINDGVGPNGRHYAYYVLDWRNPLGSAVTCFLGLILCVLTQGLLYALYRVRLWLHRKLTVGVDDGEEEDLEAVLPGEAAAAEDEDAAIFPSSISGPNYRSVDELELRTG